MKFDYVIGNPPYQEDRLGDNKGYAPPVYHRFLEESYKVGRKVEMIHPARFLFNAGSTPKQWNEKMLNDPHLKILDYEQDSSKIFSNTEIKGGVVITYHDEEQDYGAVEIFTAYPELNSILKKSKAHPMFLKFSDIVVTRTAYRLTSKMHEEHPEAILQLSAGHAYDMSTNIFERLPQIFFDEKPQDGFEYISILGREKNQRLYKYIRRDYVNDVVNMNKYKILLAKSNGAGTLGEVFSEPLIAKPMTGSTETFISIGCFSTEDEANAALKYIKTKYARILLGTLKITQDIAPDKWANVPLQDFSNKSDIDWNKTIHEIDLQLYKKYKLNEEEIKFIENTAKEMD